MSDAATMSGASGPGGVPALLLRLDGFEGPLDLLLDLSRAEKVDLGRISILAVVEQFLAVIEGARRVRLELAADWLVMAAWLAWLKSRLLLPPGSAGAEEGEQAAQDLSARLAALAAMRAAAAWLAARPILGQDVFARGQPESFVETDRSRLKLETVALLRAYLAAHRRATAAKPYRPKREPLFSVQQALERLTRMLGGAAAWTELERFLPPAETPLQRRAATASTLLAGLELARSGALALRQEVAFGPILMRTVDG
jgi:segregation and condensation protein A